MYVDPSVAFYPNSSTYGDAFVSQAYPTQNFADYVRPDSPYYHEHWLGTDPSNSANVNYVYLRFDLSSIEDKTVTFAELRVVPYHQYYNAPTATTTWVDRVTGSWTEGGLTWNNRPSSTNIGNAGLVEWQWGEFDVKSTVQAWASGTYTNYGFRLHENGNNSTYWKRLISYEQGSNRPYLSVNYHVPSVATTTPNNWKATRSVAWSYSDEAGHPQSHYQVQVSTSSSFSSIHHDSGSVSSSSTSYSIPTGVSLTSGTQYYWRVRVRDGTSWSAWDSNTFLWDSAPPAGTVSINHDAPSANASTVQLNLSSSDDGTSPVYANDGRNLTSIVAGCGSSTCGSWQAHALSLSPVEGAIVARATSSLWHSLTVDPATNNRSVLAMDVMRDQATPTHIGVVSDTNDGLRFEMRSPGGNFTTLGYTTANTPGTYATEAINVAFTPGVWYRFVVSTTGGTPGTYNMWWYERDAAMPAGPVKIVDGVYLPNPRLHAFHQGSASGAHLLLDDIKIAQNGGSAPFGSGTTSVRFSHDNATWGPWMGYADKLEYSLQPGAGSRSVYAQFRDAVGNMTDTVTTPITDSISVAFDNLGRQPQHTVESWDLGAGGSASVNLATGNLVVTHPLASLPYRGGNVLNLALTYNAQLAENVGVGPGWQLDVQRRLVLNGDGTVTFVDADGARHTFTSPNTAGSVTTYTRPATLYATLVRDTSQTDQEFTVTYRDISVDVFEDLGTTARLVRTADRHDNGIDFAYDTGSGLLDAATDPAGRVVDFTWDTAPTPDRLTAITDWAWIDGSGEVQATAVGSQRTYRLFYDGSGNLAGWSDPFDTSGSCPTAASGRTCLTYAGGLLTAIAKRQTYTTFGSGSLATGTRVAETEFAYGGSSVISVTDAADRETLIGLDGDNRRIVRRPLTTTGYGLEAASDPYARVASVWRQYDLTTPIEQRTTWDAIYPVEPASVTDNYGALMGTPARTIAYTYVASSLGLLAKMVEPLNATDDRWTEHTYNANNDVTQTVVSLEGSSTERSVTRYCYSSADPCPTANGLSLLGEIHGYVDGTGGTGAGLDDADTDVRTDYGYDAFGQRNSVVRPNRDASGAALDPREDAYEYDTAGNLTSVIVNRDDDEVDAPGSDVTPDAGTLARTDLSTAHSYDTAGNRIATADPRRAIEAAKGTTLDPDDFVTRWTYDALNRQLLESTPTTPDVDIAQREITTTYDELGAVRLATDFGQLTTATAYDATGIGTATYEQPDELSARQTSLTTLDAAGRPATSKDERQLADSGLGYTAWAYDALGRELAVASAVGTTIATDNDSTFDALDRRTKLEIGVQSTVGGLSPSSLRTQYTYDLGGRVLDSDDDFACTRETFDYLDRPTTTTSGRAGNGCGTGTEQRTIQHTYDALGRLLRDEVTAGAGSGDRTVDDTFDAVGNRLTAATRKSGVTETTTFAVNLLGQVTSEGRPDGSLSKTNYDPAGNATDRCFWRSGSGDVCKAVGETGYSDDPDQVTTTGYDARNQRISLRNGATSGETLYDPDHNYQVSAVYTPTANGREHQTLFAYDKRHRLAGATANAPAVTVQVCTADAQHECTDTEVVVATDVYAYDDNDNRTRVEEYNGSGTAVNRTYCYDAVDRLVYRNTGATACSSSAKDETFAYDDAGNRTSTIVGGVTTAFTYDAQGRLTAVGSDPIAYDSAGRTKSWDIGSSVWYFTYDPEGRLVTACKSATCAAGSDKIEFTYDGEGHRTKIVATAAGGTVTTTEFRYQGDAVVEEKVNGVIARTFVVDEAGAIVKMNIPTGGNAGDYLVSWNGHGDALHLLRVKSDGTTELANSFTYSTWGTPTILGTHDNSNNGGADYGDLGFRYLYVGEFDVQWDNTFGLGLHYMHARHYAPALGRFLQPDPDGLEDSLYAYAANNPITEIDPDGTCFIVCLVVGAVVDTALYLATTNSEDWDFGAAVTTVAVGAAESLVNPFAKISRVTHAAAAASRALSKVPKAARTASSVSWNNGWRTSNGRFAPAPSAGRPRPGATAEQQVWDAIDAKPGWSTIRGQVTVARGAMTRRYDGAAVSPSGRVIGLEIKSGTARRTTAQRQFDRATRRSSPAIVVGRHAARVGTISRSHLIKWN